MIDSSLPPRDIRFPAFEQDEPDAHWIMSHRRLGELMRSGALSANSKNMLAKDIGHGVYTIGVGSCVAIASPTGVAHISLFKPYGESQIKQVKDTLSHFKGEKISVFGLQNPNYPLLETVKGWLRDQGVHIAETHTTKSIQESFTVMVKDKKIHWFIDNGSFRS